MKLLGLRAHNFMSFRELDYIFPESGLYFVGGEVIGTAMSSSNGAGKSVMFEALSWGLFGQTIRGAGKDEIISWDGGKNCSVDVVFVGDDKQTYLVQRYRNDTEHKNELLFFQESSDLTAGTAKDTQELIDAVIGLNWSVFSTAVIFGEKAQRFVETTDAAKKEIFDEILLLQQFQDAQKKVKQDRKLLEVEIGKNLSGKMLADDRVKNVGIAIVNVSSKIEECKRQKKDIEKEIIILREEIKKNSLLYGGAVKSWEISKATYDELTAQAGALYDIVIEVERRRSNELNEIHNKKVVCQTKIGAHDRRKLQIDQVIRNAKAFKPGSSCPTCGQQITQGSVQSVLNHYAEEVTGMNRECLSVSNELMKLTNQYNESKTKLDVEYNDVHSAKIELDIEIKKQNDIIQVRQRDSQMIEAAIKKDEYKIKMIESEESNRENQLLEDKKKFEETLINCEQEVKKFANEEILLKEKDGHLKFWEEGFGNKGIKSLLLDEIIPQLNTRVNFYATSLLDDVIGISFDTESTLKSGESRDRFDVKISRENSKIDYILCSAGERRRIDIAILLALQSLVFERNAKNCNLLVFDEVFDSLDRTGVERVVNLLNEEAKQKTIYVISHMQEFRDFFEQEIIVRKKDGISSIIEESKK